MMKQSKVIATPLYKLCCRLKSQERWSDEWVRDARDWICEIYSEWCDTYPGQDVFPKLHDIVTHVCDFVDRERMCGRLSEESFKSMHQRIKREKVLTNRIAKSEVWPDCLSNRLQLSTKESVKDVMVDLRSKLTGAKRGPYATKGNATKNTNTIAVVETTFNRDDESNDIILINADTAIKAEWADAWEMAVKGRVPRKWHQVFPASGSLLEPSTSRKQNISPTNKIQLQNESILN
jgi:hypothetical protein